MTKILAIDDDQNGLRAISMLLERKITSCSVMTAQSGLEGIEKAREWSPDTIILDLQMPDINGFDVCQILKKEEETKHIPIIMLTGVGVALENRVKGLNTGADAFLTKPVESDELTAHIKAVLRIKETEERLRKERNHQEDLVQKRTKALQERDRAFFTMTNHLPGMVYRCNNDPDWTMVFVSDGCHALTGCEPEALVNNTGISYADMIHEEDRQMVWETVQDGVKNNKPFQATYRIVTTDGEMKWVWEQGQGIFENDGRIFIEGFITDITKQKKAEEALKESEEALKTQSHHLMEVNTALKVLLKQKKDDKDILQENFLSNVKELVLPHIERLKISGLSGEQRAIVDVMESNLNNIVSPFLGKLSSRHMGLTPMEIRVADLVKEGKTNKEMAAFLCLSTNTISAHRYNLRTKLGLKNKKTNLRSFLLSLGK